MTPGAHLLALPVRAYRLFLSPWVGHGCRFHPTCSAYALEALETHGALRGGWLTLRRLARCHPWGGSGIDNVPPKGPSDEKRALHDRSERQCHCHPDP
jgi:putative membrane protein insertion efficiency factor